MAAELEKSSITWSFNNHQTYSRVKVLSKGEVTPELQSPPKKNFAPPVPVTKHHALADKLTARRAQTLFLLEEHKQLIISKQALFL